MPITPLLILRTPPQISFEPDRFHEDQVQHTLKRQAHHRETIHQLSGKEAKWKK